MAAECRQPLSSPIYCNFLTVPERHFLMLNILAFKFPTSLPYAYVTFSDLKYLQFQQHESLLCLRIRILHPCFPLPGCPMFWLGPPKRMSHNSPTAEICSDSFHFLLRLGQSRLMLPKAVRMIRVFSHLKGLVECNLRTLERLDEWIHSESCMLCTYVGRGMSK